jgi:hypothetical protein
MATEAARFQGRPLKEDHSTTKGNYKTDLTLTGLLMEGPIHTNRISFESDFGLVKLNQEMIPPNPSLSKVSTEEAILTQWMILWRFNPYLPRSRS